MLRRDQKQSTTKKWSYNIWANPPPFVSELLTRGSVMTPLRDSQVLLEAGVLAYRRQKHGGIEILPVSKRRSKRWGIPKGRVEPHLSFSELAAKEAFEEAGVIGMSRRIQSECLGEANRTRVGYLIR
jgi:ADP-ribose pyrophosphatase YjhB (NUDIX family)